MKAHVRPNGVVVVDCAINCLYCCRQGAEGDKESKLHFKNPIYAFRNGVFVGVAIFGSWRLR